MNCETCGGQMERKGGMINLIGSAALFITGVLVGILINGIVGFIIGKIGFIAFVLSFERFKDIHCSWCQ